MGRITNAVGIRLGGTSSWKSYGVVLNKTHCMLYYSYILSIVNIINSAVLQDKGYLFAKASVLQDKNVSILNIYFYIRDVSRYYKQSYKKFSKLLKRYKLKKKRRLKKKSFRFFKRKRRRKKIYNFLITKIKIRNIVKNKLHSNKVHKFIRHSNQLKNNKIMYKKNILKRWFTKSNLRIFVKRLDNFFKKKGVPKNWFFIFVDQVVLYKKRYKQGLSLFTNFTLRKKVGLLKYMKLKRKIFFRLFIYFLLKKKDKVNMITNKIFTFLKIKDRIYRLGYLKKGSYKNNDVLYKKKIFLKEFLINKNNLLKKLFLLELIGLEKNLLLSFALYAKEDFICNYFLINNYNFSAQLLASYISIKLKQKFTLNQTLKPLTKYLKKLIKKKYIFGFKFQLNGRFSRKQRATALTYKGGSMPLATIGINIDFFKDFVSLKDGVGGIQVWLYKTKKTKVSRICLRNYL